MYWSIWILGHRWRLILPGYYGFILIYAEKVEKYDISNILFIDHLHLLGFINPNVIDVGSFIYMYNDRVILRIVYISRYGINNLFKLTRYFKT